jgi:amidase
MSFERFEEFVEKVDRIDRPGSDIELRSVIAIDHDAVHRSSTGPLSDRLILVKDNIEAVGLPCTAGSLALEGAPVRGDAEFVSRLRAAGMIVAGSTNLSEWANIRSTGSSSGWSAVGGLTANPWALDRSAGGSSSGSGAAVAAGLVDVAIGTETDGSITCPAALNGVVGIKPTVGSVSTVGVVPVSGSQDVPGPLARNIEVAAEVLAVLSGDLDLVARSRRIDVGVLRVGVARAWLTGHVATDRLFEEFLALVEREVREFRDCAIPDTEMAVHEDEFTVLVHELKSDLDAYLADRVPISSGRPRSIAEVIAFNEREAGRELIHFGQDIFERASACSGRDSDDYHAARRRNIEWARAQCFGPAFDAFDVLIAPAYAPAWKTDFVLGHPNAGGKVTTPAAIAGLPIVTIPMGLVAGLPVGVCLVGPSASEDRLIAVARRLEGRLGLVDDPSWRPTFIHPSRG